MSKEQFREICHIGTQTAQAELSIQITGVLLDTDVGADDFSLNPFCNTVYRTSEMLREDIVQKLITERAR